MVAAASPLAQRAGVQIDMPLAEAKSLLFRSSRDQPFHILAHDPAADLYAIEKLADELDSFSPIVALQQDVDHPDCIFLDIRGLAPLFGSELQLAKGVDRSCRERGFLVEIAIADTIGQAQALAQYRERVQGSGFGVQEEDGKVQGDSAFHNPNSVCDNIFILNGADVLQQLPTPALRLSDWAIETLHQLGVVTIGQLMNLPRKDLSARFGTEIHQRLDQLSGKLAEPIVARHAPSEFYAEQLLDYPTSDRETIEVIMQRLIEEICKEMSAAQQGALQWTIRLYGQHKLPLKLCVSLFEPTATAQHVMQLATMQFEQLLMTAPKGSGALSRNSPQGTSRKKSSASHKRLPTPLLLGKEPLQVNEITVSVTSCVLLVQKQRQLFDENPRLDKQELAHLINRLSGRMGRQNVVYPTIVSGAQPEFAFQFRPLVDPHRKGARRTTTSTIASSSHVISRPLKMFRPAIHLEFKGNHATDPLHARLIVNQQTHTIAWRWGPERIETGWWRGRTTRRDYWRVETQTHQQFWIYRDLRRKAWFLHGEF